MQSERRYPASEVRGGDKRSYPASEVRGGGPGRYPTPLSPRPGPEGRRSYLTPLGLRPGPAAGRTKPMPWLHGHRRA